MKMTSSCSVSVSRGIETRLMTDWKFVFSNHLRILNFNEIKGNERMNNFYDPIVLIYIILCETL